MKKKALLLFTIVLCLLTWIASIQKMDELTGSWNYQVEQTEPQYRSGTIIIEQGEDEEYSGKIVFQSGREISMRSVTVEADTVTFKAYIDGGLITTVCTLEEDVLRGRVRTPEGMLQISATREE